MDNSLTNQPRAQRTETGFSLIETVVVIAIVGLCSAIAIPFFLSWRQNYQLQATVKEVYSSIQKARMKAIKNNEDWAVKITDTAGQKSCDFYSGDGGDGTWNDGNETMAFSVDFTKPGDIIFQEPGGAASTALMVLRVDGTCLPGNIYISNVNNSRFYRVQLSPAGGITMHMWSGTIWQ